MWSRFLREWAVVMLAAVAIVHVEYDVLGADDGREWIEISNEGAESVDMTGWKLFEEGVNHRLTSVTGAVVPPGGSAIIADSVEKFLADHPGYAGLLFDSSFSLKNTGETLVLKDSSGNEVVSHTYVPKALPPRSETPFPQAARNLSADPEVTDARGLASVAMALPSSSAAVGAVVTDGREARNGPFGILPWIVGLIAVSGAGIAAIFLKRQKNRSDYRIIEDKSES